MVKTMSSMLPLGTLAPEFSLIDVTSNASFTFKRSTHHRATVIMFICNHCPYVKHIRDGLVDLANHYIPLDVGFIAINANDVDHYPDDSPQHMKEVAQTYAFPFPYLFDETQEVALAYEAKCTPDFFVFDQNSSLVYRGQFDAARPGNDTPVTGESIRQAIDCVLRGETIQGNQYPSLGCNIKWK